MIKSRISLRIEVDVFRPAMAMGGATSEKAAFTEHSGDSSELFLAPLAVLFTILSTFLLLRKSYKSTLKKVIEPTVNEGT